MKEKKSEFSLKINIETSYINPSNILKWIHLAPSFHIKRFQCDDIKKLKLGVNWSEVDLDSVFMHLKSVQFPIFLEFKDQYENSLLIGIHEKYSFLLFDVYHLENPMDHWIGYAKSFFEDENIGIVAYFYPKNDLFWQTNVDPGQYELYGKPLVGVKLRPINKVRNLIDRRSLPGFPNEYRNLWFGSTWKMIYGQKYFQFISKEQLCSYSDAYEIKKLNANAIEITLFEDLEEYETIESRTIQKNFREFMRIDQIVEHLENNDENV